MADYFTPTIVQQIIPDADMTPLELLLLSHIFDREGHGDGWYFFADQNPCATFSVTRADLEKALASSADPESTAHQCVTEQLADTDAGASEIDIDLSGVSWEEFFRVRQAALLWPSADLDEDALADPLDRARSRSWATRP